MFGKLCGGTFVRRITMYLNALGGGGFAWELTAST